MEKLVFGLSTMLLGMIVVFIGLVVLILAIVIASKLIKASQEKKKVQAS